MLLGRNFEPKLPSMLEGAACLKEQTEERCCSLKSGFKKKSHLGGSKQESWSVRTVQSLFLKTPESYS